MSSDARPASHSREGSTEFRAASLSTSANEINPEEEAPSSEDLGGGESSDDLGAVSSEGVESEGGEGEGEGAAGGVQEVEETGGEGDIAPLGGGGKGGGGGGRRKSTKLGFVMKGAGGGGSAHKLSTQASARNLGGGRGRGHGRGGLGSKARSTRLSFGADGSAHASASAASSPSSSQQHLQDAGDFDLSSTLTSTRDLRATSAFTGGLESVARSGQLMKRGHLRKTWKTRHFHLEEGFLTYSTSAPAEGGKRKGQVCLLGTTLLIEPRPDKEDEARAQGAQTPFIFKLTLADGTPARKTLLLCAESQSNMHAWIASIGSSWVDPNGTTGMMRAAQAGYLDDMKLMVTVGVDINLQNNDGWTALMIAAREGHLDCIAELLRHGANLNMQSLTGNTCLMDAVRDQHDEVLQFLLDRGADPNIHNDDGSSAAMVAVQGGDHRSLRILIAHDADLATPNDLGLTPLMQVARAQPALDDTSSEEEEEEGEGEGEGGEGGGGGGGAPREPKDRMAGVMACLELLIDQGVDLDAAQPSTGDNAMMCAARVGNAAAVRLLAQRGANVHHINHAHKTVGDVAELTGQGKVHRLARDQHFSLVFHLLTRSSSSNSFPTTRSLLYLLPTKQKQRSSSS